MRARLGLWLAIHESSDSCGKKKKKKKKKKAPKRKANARDPLKRQGSREKARLARGRAAVNPEQSRSISDAHQVEPRAEGNTGGGAVQLQ